MSDGLIFVVDDDDAVRRALSRLLASAGYRSESFASPIEFMARPPYDGGPSCLVLDLQMPGMTGLELQLRLREAGHLVPIVFITGHGDIPTSVQAMRRGAVDFLSKPFTDEQLLAAIDTALERDRGALASRRTLRDLVTRWHTLTPREREVFALVVQGLLNKQVAGRLGTAEKTIKAHRAKVVEKMGASSLAELVRMADALRGTLPDGSI
jgi:FixJ family two-component response regulator